MRSQNVGLIAYTMPPPRPVVELGSSGICHVYVYGSMP